jgi:3-dehydrosphinganine reductase
VTTAAECSRVVAEATAWNDGSPPDIVWCCSGSAHPTLFIDTPIEQLQTMMDSNYFSCAYMAHAILNAWLCDSSSQANPLSDVKNSSADTKTTAAARHKPLSQSGTPPRARHLVFTGSFVTLYSFAGFTPYAPSKAAIRSLADSLSQEMNLYNVREDRPAVRVHTVLPATMPTKSLDDENRVKTDLTHWLEEGDMVLQPEECARRAIRGLERGQELVATSIIIHLVMTSVLGGSIRGGWVKGFVDTLTGWVVMVVMVFIRADHDAKVTKWGREHGTSGMLSAKKGK